MPLLFDTGDILSSIANTTRLKGYLTTMVEMHASNPALLFVSRPPFPFRLLAAKVWWDCADVVSGCARALHFLPHACAC